ncbi:ATP synthase subunit I [Anaerotalea alkaliphila]|uniref:ATP synthase subunit I n=1 Tax=Anaerotalea alkaliphila TaxID=2662126 RepID=A0A7X5HU47_9FIRM|nr:ATP synthase subunit I [Anaerotalea alkaliphila]NDL66710.1 hypothetical protein [Anaerotalea alkaliphila]
MTRKKRTEVSLSLKALAITAAVGLPGIFLVRSPQAFVLGLLLGVAFTIGKIWMMGSTFQKAVRKHPVGARNYVRAQYFLRYLLTLLLLVVAALEPGIHVAGVAVGLLSLKGAAYWQAMRMRLSPKDGSVKFQVWEEEDEENSDF